MQRERRAVGLPVQGCRPAVGIAHVPAFGQPQRSLRVPAVGNKVRILAYGDRPRRHRERVDKHAVARLLVVETKARAAKTDLAYAVGQIDPRQRRGARRR